MGITQPDDTQFYQAAGHNAGYYGYYPVDPESAADNFNTAFEVLSRYYTVVDEKITDFPEISYILNSSTAHMRIAQSIQSSFAAVGITMTIIEVSWNELLQMRAEGNFTIARNGWISDFNDAISFLDMFESTSGNNSTFVGMGNHADAVFAVDLSDLDMDSLSGTWTQTYDVLIRMIKQERDADVRNALMHKAEDLLMETGTVCPIYYYTDIYMLSDQVEGFFTTPLGGKYFMYTSYK